MLQTTNKNNAEILETNATLSVMERELRNELEVMQKGSSEEGDES